MLVLALVWLNVDLFPAEGWALGSADMRGLFYPWWEFVRNSLFKSEIPFWDPRHFAGSPFLHNPQIAFFYLPNWLVFGMPINIGISFYYLFHLWIAGWGMARLVEALGREADDKQPIFFGVGLGSLLAGVAFMAGGFFASRIYAGHVGFLATHVWLPWLLVATSRGLHHKQWRYVAAAGLIWALAILAGHTTTLLYLGMIWVLFIGWHWWQQVDRNVWFAAKFGAVSLLLGLWIASVQLWPTLQLIQRSGRVSQGGYNFATRFSLPWRQLMTLLVPEFFGEPAVIGYWGAENFDELTAYAGGLALLAVGVVIVQLFQRSYTGWPLFFVGLLLFGMMIALGSNGFVYRLLYVTLPPFRVMRAPGRALFFFAFAAPILLGWMVRDLFNRPFGGQKILRDVAKVALILGFILIASLALTWWSADGDILNRRWHQLQNSAFSVTVWLVVIGLLHWLVVQNPRSGRAKIGSAALLCLVLLDLGAFGQKLIKAQPMTPATLWFEAASVPGIHDGRILPWGINIFEQNGAGQLGMRSVFGYNTLENGAVTRLAASVPDPRSKAFDLLHATHVVSESGLEQFTTDEDGLDGLVLISEINTTRVYARPNVMPYARLVYQAETIADPEAQYARLHQPDFNPADVVLFEEDSACALPSNLEGVNGSVTEVQNVGGHLDLQVETATAAWLVISEANFPGWNATINGADAETVTAYSALQAICVPAGAHDVSLRFRPIIFLWGGLATLLGLFFAGWLWAKKEAI